MLLTFQWPPHCIHHAVINHSENLIDLSSAFFTNGEIAKGSKSYVECAKKKKNMLLFLYLNNFFLLFFFKSVRYEHEFVSPLRFFGKHLTWLKKNKLPVFVRIVFLYMPQFIWKINSSKFFSLCVLCMSDLQVYC